MERTRWLAVILSILISMASACKVPYSNPPITFQDFDLVGTWEARYMEWGVDELTLRADGTFKQIYKDRNVKDYVFETPWSEWWVERFPDGRVRLHLQGARYYKVGINVAELDGMRHPCPENLPDCWGGLEPPPHNFYDPINKEFVQMVGELVLNVQSDSEQLVLLHMLLSSDQGFVSLTGKATGFHRVATP